MRMISRILSDRQTIYTGCLEEPRSPVVPHTPFLGGDTRPAARNTQGSHPPRTPYTPFTAFASKQNPFEMNFDQHAQAHLLDETDDPLASLYNSILRFVDRDLKRIMELAEKTGVKTASGTPKLAQSKSALLALSVSSDKQSALSGGFDIMANVVWAEIGKALMDELGGVIFAAGNPDEFRKVSKTCSEPSYSNLFPIASRNYSSIHTSPRISCTINAGDSVHARAPSLHCIRTALAASGVLPIAMERNSHQARRSACCCKARAITLERCLLVDRRRLRPLIHLFRHRAVCNAAKCCGMDGYI